MKAWYRRWPFISGIALMAITNAVVLAGVIHNRSGSPESLLTLTHRELALPYGYGPTREDSGLALTMLWRVEQPDVQAPMTRSTYYGGEVAWLDAAKLDELGIRVRARSLRNVDSPSYASSLPSNVLLVLEMNGPAYQRQLDRACRRTDEKDARKDCEQERHEASRLFIVDAGLDRDALRRKYPDTTTYAIAHGQIAAVRVSGVSESSLSGRVRGIATDEIQVPASMRAALDPGAVGRWDARKERPFDATIAFGRRIEPWIVKLSSPPGQ